MARYLDNKDPDDLFVDTRMSFGDHLEDLRVHLWRAVAGFGIAMLFSFAIAKPVLSGIIVRPVEQQLQQFYDEISEKRAKEVLDEAHKNPDLAPNKPRVVKVQFLRNQRKDFAEGREVELVENPEALPAEDWVTMQMRIPEPVDYSAATLPAQRLLGPRPTMKTFSITEAFMVYVKIAVVCGFVIGSPWIFYQIWLFIAAGLYPHEKKYVHIYVPFSVGLFLAGAMLCQFVVLPRAIMALLWFNEWLHFEPDLRLNEWLGFALLLPVIFGFSFQTPLVMLFLERLGIFTVESYRSKRRIAFFILAVIAAVGPTVDAFSMLFQWAALCLLYQLGIWLCVWSARQGGDEIDVPESGEMVEV